MEPIQSFRYPSALFNTSYNLSIRIWHWLTFITITASIVMVLLASTLFTMKDNSPMVQEQVKQKGGIVSSDQAKAVAHEYNDKLWNAHKIIGYGISLLVLFRIIIEVAYSKEKKLGNKIKMAFALQTRSDVERKDRRHYIWVKWGYVLFYFFIFIMALTGLGLAYEDVPFLKDINGTLSDIHSIVQYFIYAYILFHLVGVIRADITDNKGIVSAMIHGEKR
ncbi:MAG: hypothetical protein NVS1B13_11180 [Flavisolibacter sp.]